jgi:hypothetical protein
VTTDAAELLTAAAKLRANPRDDTDLALAELLHWEGELHANVPHLMPEPRLTRLLAVARTINGETP